LIHQCAAQAGQQWESKKDEQGRSVQSLKIQAPSMTEEDQYGYTMPTQYRCDACKVVVHHLGEALKARQPKNRRLKEWEYQEVFDEVCQSGLSGYGIALVNGENVLSGPALKRDNLEPGMGAIQMGGETWEKRLGEICRKFVYDKLGEDELYEHFRKEGTISPDLCVHESRDCQIGPKVSSKKESSQKQAPRVKKDDSSEAALDVSTFIAKLAKKHGVAKGEYTRKRSFSEWETLFIQAAGRISPTSTTKVDQIVDL
jgi:hypothetical protein